MRGDQVRATATTEVTIDRSKSMRVIDLSIGRTIININAPSSSITRLCTLFTARKNPKI